MLKWETTLTILKYKHKYSHEDWTVEAL